MKRRIIILPLLLLSFLLFSCTQKVATTPYPENSDSAIALLLEKNKEYQEAVLNNADISLLRREDSVENGQAPYSVILSCADSRVIPEHIFMSGIGELFTVRNAGNIVDTTVLGTIEYGVAHLGAKVIVVLGHTECGAVHATIHDGGHDNISHITDEIALGIKDEQNARVAEILNVQNSIAQILKSNIVSDLIKNGEIALVGAIYNSTSGEVVFLDDAIELLSEADRSKIDYHEAVLDAILAERFELEDLVVLDVTDDMTTWNDDEVLLITWNKYPQSYPNGQRVKLKYGSIWTFSDKEILAWYEETRGEVANYHLRLNQLLGLPPDDDNTHFTAIWVDPQDVIRPAYFSDVKSNKMDISNIDMDDEYKKWFDENTIDSYFGEWQYPWTRLGYTYDWSGDGDEYGLSEFLIKENSEVTVEFTMTTEEFLKYLESESL